MVPQPFEFVVCFKGQKHDDLTLAEFTARYAELHSPKAYPPTTRTLHLHCSSILCDVFGYTVYLLVSLRSSHGHAFWNQMCSGWLERLLTHLESRSLQGLVKPSSRFRGSTCRRLHHGFLLLGFSAWPLQVKQGSLWWTHMVDTGVAALHIELLVLWWWRRIPTFPEPVLPDWNLQSHCITTPFSARLKTFCFRF